MPLSMYNLAFAAARSEALPIQLLFVDRTEKRMTYSLDQA
jgi:hypothetical protein